MQVVEYLLVIQKDSRRADSFLASSQDRIKDGKRTENEQRTSRAAEEKLKGTVKETCNSIGVYCKDIIYLFPRKLLWLFYIRDQTDPYSQQ